MDLCVNIFAKLTDMALMACIWNMEIIISNIPEWNWRISILMLPLQEIVSNHPKIILNLVLQ